jgi:hypothetical protein
MRFMLIAGVQIQDFQITAWPHKKAQAKIRHTRPN